MIAFNLLPDRIKTHWANHEAGQFSYEEFQRLEKLELDRYQAFWTEALILPPHKDLYESLVSEIASYTGLKADEIKVYCDNAVEDLAALWRKGHVQPGDPAALRAYYESKLWIYELMAWHSLRLDNTPLAYVMALEFAKKTNRTKHLDFGSGVGSGTILFERHGIGSWACDISATLLNFGRFRLNNRMTAFAGGSPMWAGVENLWKHLKGQFDFITAMEVFEHLYDPIGMIDNLHDVLTPGGYLFIQLSSCHPDPERPQHIVTDPQPIFKRLDELGMVKVWSDNWVWGHDVFQKGGK